MTGPLFVHNNDLYQLLNNKNMWLAGKEQHKTRFFEKKGWVPCSMHNSGGFYTTQSSPLL